jgi:hypothetical protein
VLQDFASGMGGVAGVTWRAVTRGRRAGAGCASAMGGATGANTRGATSPPGGARSSARTTGIKGGCEKYSGVKILFGSIGEGHLVKWTSR